MQESIKETVDCIVSLIEKNKSQRYLEYEFRIGHLFPDYFNSEINKRHFYEIKKTLDTMELDNSVEIVNIEYTVEYDDTGRRRILDKTVKKTALDTVDFYVDNSPFDIRFSISKEQPVKIFSDNIVKTMKKKRTSYKYRAWSYDLTITDDTKYSIELELDPKATKSDLRKIIYSTLVKVLDFTNIVEKTSIPGSIKKKNT